MSTTLEQIRVATPCHVSWNEMEGDGAVRYCAQCSLNVYNLSDMTREDAESLIAQTEGRVCVRLYRRQDGSVITRDCPVGRRTLWRQTAALVGGVSGVMFVAATGVLAAAGFVTARNDGLSLFQKITPPTLPWQEEEVIMGDMCIPAEDMLPPIPQSAPAGEPAPPQA